MGYDTNGNWTSDFYPETDRDEGVKILASKFQKLIQTDIKDGFDNCLTRDGSGKPQSNLNFNGHKITNLADGELAQDAVTVSQAQKGQMSFANDTSITANEIVVTFSPALTAYTVGERFYFKVANTNTIAEVSFTANGLDVCRVQMDGSDTLVAGALKQNCIYCGVYYENGNTAETTYGGRRIQVLSQASDLANTLNHTQITNCILSAPNGVASQSGLVITLNKDVRFLMYHGTNADGSIDNLDYTTSAATTYTFAGTETDGTYYLFVDNSGVITPSTDYARQTDKAIFAQCEMESGAIVSFSTIGILELLKASDKQKITSWGVPDYENGVTVGVVTAGAYTQVLKDSFVVTYGSDPYLEDYYVYVSPDNGTTRYIVGRRRDDENGQTEDVSFSFFVPKGWYFSNVAELGYYAHIYPLKGAE